MSLSSRSQKAEDEPANLGPASGIAQGAWLVGTADEVGQQVVGLQRDLGLEYVNIFPHFPGMVREQGIEQIERFAQDIMPMLARSAEPLGVGS